VAGALPGIFGRAIAEATKKGAEVLTEDLITKVLIAFGGPFAEHWLLPAAARTIASVLR
jgi:hypothetical protein